MTRHAIVDQATNVVENIVRWDGSPSWAPPDGKIAVALADGQACEPGAVYNPGNGTFSDGRSLAVVKAAKLAELRAQAINRLAEMLPNFDGNESMTRAETAFLILQLFNAGAALRQRIEDARVNYAAHADAIRALNNKAQVAAYDFTTGWPA